MSDLAARNGGRVGLAALVAILLLGLGLRGYEAWDGRPPVYDAQGYADIAVELERGNGFALGPGATQPATNYSPGLPLFASGLYALTGGVHERMARLVLALIGTLAVLFSYLIGRRLSGPLAGLVGAAAVAIYPALLEYQGMLMSEPLAASSCPARCSRCSGRQGRTVGGPREDGWHPACCSERWRWFGRSIWRSPFR